MEMIEGIGSKQKAHKHNRTNSVFPCLGNKKREKKRCISVHLRRLISIKKAGEMLQGGLNIMQITISPLNATKWRK